MPELLLINPGKVVTKKRKTHRSAAQRRATAKLVAMNKARRGGKARKAHRKARRRNPANPLHAYRSATRGRRRARRVTRARRRRNPISLGRAAGVMGMFTDALVQGAGAVAFDVGYGYVNKMLPASLQRTPGSVGAGDAVKALLTAVVGKMLGRRVAIVRKMAQGALTVQARDVIATFVPDSMKVGRVGWATAAPVLDMSARTAAPGMGAYMQPGMTALLNGRTGAYAPPGMTALLNGASGGGARVREGWANRR